MKEIQTERKLRGRPRTGRSRFTSILIKKEIKDVVDDYCFRNRLRMSYAKFIEYCVRELDKKNENDALLKELLNKIN